MHTRGKRPVGKEKRVLTLADFPIGSYAWIPRTVDRGTRRSICQVLAHDTTGPGIKVQPEGDPRPSIVQLSQTGVAPAVDPNEGDTKRLRKELQDSIRHGRLDAAKQLILGLPPAMRCKILTAKVTFAGSQHQTLVHLAAGGVDSGVDEDVANDVLKLVLEHLQEAPLHSLKDHLLQTVIFDAAFDHRVDALEILLAHPSSREDRRALVNSCDQYGQTCLHAVAKKAAECAKHATPECISTFSEIASLLVRYGATVNMCDNSGWNAVHHCVPEEGRYDKGLDQPRQRQAVRQLAAFCEVLIDTGCKVDRPDKQGCTALFWAVAYGCDGLAPLVQTLCRHGADPSRVQGAATLQGLAAKNLSWRTPLECAAQSMNSDEDSDRMAKILRIMQLDEQGRRRLPHPAQHSRPSNAGPSNAGPSNVSAKRQPRHHGAARKAPRPASAEAAAPAASAICSGAMVSVSMPLEAARELARLLYAPACSVVDSQFEQHECRASNDLQLLHYSPRLQEAKQAMEAAAVHDVSRLG